MKEKLINFLARIIAFGVSPFGMWYAENLLGTKVMRNNGEITTLGELEDEE